MTQSSCYFCGSSADIEEHHILPQRFDGSDSDGNTVDVCHECHWKLERLYNKDFWESIGVDDPRATKESHVSCDIHSCMEPSVQQYGTSEGIVHRCEDHKRELGSGVADETDFTPKSVKQFRRSE